MLEAIQLKLVCVTNLKKKQAATRRMSQLGSRLLMNALFVNLNQQVIALFIHIDTYLYA